MTNLTITQKQRVNGLINLKALFIDALKKQGVHEAHRAMMVKELLYSVHFNKVK